MPRPAVTVGRRRTDRGRRRAARTSLVASGILPTYDMLYGSQCGLLFEEQCREAGYRETDGGWWPTEEKALHAEGAIFREGTHGAVYRLADGTLAHVHLDRDSIRVTVAGPTRAACVGAVSAFQGLYPASFVTTEGDNRVPVTFWANSAFGPQPRLRRIEASPWEPIVGNYTAEVRDELAALMAWDEPGSEGQLLLWQGPPGTGKTWALRALACEWSRWAEFHYITDPDSFFVDDPSYMVNVLLSDSYSVVDAVDGSVFEEQAEGKWRVLILEDTGELLSANAKEKYGQGLSRLLNVVDGMIGQGLRVLCLVTTNDELGELNEAVRRPGRCASQIVFGPLSDEESQAWTGDESATAGTIAELYSRYGRADAEPRDASFEDEPEDARDLMASMPPSLREEGTTLARAEAQPDGSIRVDLPHGLPSHPKMVEAVGRLVFSERDASDIRAEIARVAEAHQDEAEGYGETAWDESTRTVIYVAGDWTDVDPIAADFLAIDGVDGFAYEMEGCPDGWCEAEIVYGGDPFRCGEQAALEAVVALASQPLEIELDAEELAAILATVTAALEPEPVEPLVAEVPFTTAALIDVLGKFAEREHAPAPTFNLHFPQHLGLRIEQADVTVPVTVEPAPPTPLEVHSHSHVEVPAQEPPIVHNHVPAQDAPIVHNHVEIPAPPPARAAATGVRVDSDERGNKVYVLLFEDGTEEVQA